MKRIQRGPVRGISLKLQEEERERRLDFIPQHSALEKEVIDVDKDTEEMLKAMNMKIEGLRVLNNKKVSGIVFRFISSSVVTRRLNTKFYIKWDIPHISLFVFHIFMSRLFWAFHRLVLAN